MERSRDRRVSDLVCSTTAGGARAPRVQDEKRLPRGLGFGAVLDELLPCIPFVKIPSGGESIVVPRVTASLSALSAWRAVGTAPTKGTPADASYTFTFQRIDSLSEDDLTLAEANRDPNSVADADTAIRRASIERNLASALVTGDDTTTGGFLGWENMTVAQANRVDLPSNAIGTAGIIESCLQTDDTCNSGSLGGGAAAFVTTALGRRNIERSAQIEGFGITYGPCKGLPYEVPYMRGRPILVSSGLANDAGPPAVAPLYAVDFRYVFMVATTGEPEDYCIESRRMSIQDTGSIGTLLWFHGAMVVRHGAALVRTEIDTTQST